MNCIRTGGMGGGECERGITGRGRKRRGGGGVGYSGGVRGGVGEERGEDKALC